MGKGFVSSVKLTGEDDFKKALNGITDNLRTLSSEMKVVTSQYDKNDKSAENLTSQNEVLRKKIKEQEEAVRVYKNALEQAKTETGENSVTTQKWQANLNNAQADLNKLNRQLENNERTMSEATDGTKEETSALKDFGTEADNSGKKALSLGDIIKGNLISDAIKSGLSALASGIKKNRRRNDERYKRFRFGLWGLRTACRRC